MQANASPDNFLQLLKIFGSLFASAAGLVGFFLDKGSSIKKWFGLTMFLIFFVVFLALIFTPYYSDTDLLGHHWTETVQTDLPCSRKLGTATSIQQVGTCGLLTEPNTFRITITPSQQVPGMLPWFVNGPFSCDIDGASISAVEGQGGSASCTFEGNANQRIAKFTTSYGKTHRAFEFATHHTSIHSAN